MCLPVPGRACVPRPVPFLHIRAGCATRRARDQPLLTTAHSLSYRPQHYKRRHLVPRPSRRTAATVDPRRQRSRLGPRSNLVLTQEQDARVKALEAATEHFMGEPMKPTAILRAAVSIGLVTLEQQFGLSPGGSSAAAPASTAYTSQRHYAATRRKASALTRR